jgi:hypothetical protein
MAPQRVDFARPRKAPNTASQKTGIYGKSAFFAHLMNPPLTKKRRRQSSFQKEKVNDTIAGHVAAVVFVFKRCGWSLSKTPTRSLSV